MYKAIVLMKAYDLETISPVTASSCKLATFSVIPLTSAEVGAACSLLMIFSRFNLSDRGWMVSGKSFIPWQAVYIVKNRRFNR